jgi:membrane fusion protein, multidrug efflux system
VEQHPRYRDAVAQRDEAARQLDHTVVKAPFAGIVTMCPCPCSKIRSAGKA